MSENSNDEIECNCGCIDYIDAFWDKYKYKIASPLSISLSVCGATSGLLVPYFAVASSIAITITNVSIFFTSILLTKYMTENKNLNTDNISLKNENRRLTYAKISIDNITPKNDSDFNSVKSIEPINFDEMHRNNAIANYTFQN